MIEWIVSIIVAVFIVSFIIISLYVLANAMLFCDSMFSGDYPSFEEKVCAIIVSVLIVLLVIGVLTCYVKGKIYGDDETTKIVCNEGDDNCERPFQEEEHQSSN